MMTAVEMMGCQVSTEGIETVEQLAWLTANGGYSGQGYLFSAAVTPDELDSLMRRGPFKFQA
jgi:EAL domain-containing protein (putative c-di-GMP-specific phosphodiesterase class I)